MRRIRSKAPTAWRRRGGIVAVLLASVVGMLALATAGSAHVESTPTAPVTFTQSAFVSFKLEGCRNDGSITFPSNGPFICPDAAYTTGNLGKGWNELDLVPHRLTTGAGTQPNATTDYNVLVAADYLNGGSKIGYDVISDPVVNASKSDASCTVSASAQAISQGVTGGAQQTISRTLTIHQDKGTTCVIDYYQRLALGAHLYSGSSLQSYMFEKEDFSTGKRTVSIPVNEILPQQLRKDMTATQGQGFTWNLTKEAKPINLSFEDTCSKSGAAQSKDVEISVTWTKSDPAPNGDITITTNIYAKNPASRTITVTASDTIYKGTTQTTAIDSFNGAPVDVSPNSEKLLFTHTLTRPAGDDTSYNDKATATYTDKVTGVPVPGTTEATASANVVLVGTGANDSMTINDSESISGSGLSFKVASPSVGDFVAPSEADPLLPYVAGDSTVGPVNWSYTTSSGGSVKFVKSVTVTGATSTTGTLSDAAQIVGDGDTVLANASASTSISSTALVTLRINKSIPDVLSGSETETFNFSVKDGGNNVVATPSITFTAGQTTGHVDVTGLAPDTYTVSETSSGSGKWALQGDQSTTISLPSCLGSVSFTNNFAPAAAQVRKVTDPPGSEAGWDMYLNGPGITPPGEKVTTTSAGFIGFTTVLEQGTYTITETGKAGWAQIGSRGCTFTVNYPADAGQLFSCSIVNRSRGHVKVVKTVSGAAPSGTQAFTFTLREAANTTSTGTILQTLVANAGNSGTLNFTTDLVPGQHYQMCEDVMPGWNTTLPAPLFVPGSMLTVTLPNPDVNNMTVCHDFVAEFGGTTEFDVDNSPPPGGRALTIGFWKNWASCTTSSTSKKPVLDQTLAASDPTGITIGVETLHATTISPTITGYTGGSCKWAVSVLNKSDVKSGKKLASDPAYNLAAQLLAARLNFVAGAGVCPAAVTASDQAQALLAKYQFNGTGSYKPSAADTATMNQLAQKLDKYNNDLLC